MTLADEGPTTADARADGVRRTDASRRAVRHPGRRAAVLLVLLLAVPLIVASFTVAHPTWYAHDDYALTEIRVRDVTSTRPPLVGLSGRIEHDGRAGSHPGPLSFYLLAPGYRLLGSSSWALQVSTAALGVAAMGLAVGIGRRRGGTVGATATAAGLATLLVAYGPERWMMPWNPSLPLLWWPVVLLAAWSVLCRDWPVVLVFVGAASLCAQTHISYLGLVGGLGVLVATRLAWATWQARRHAAVRPLNGEAPPGAEPTSERPGRWLLAGAALLVVLWIPPVVDALAHDPSNVSIIAGQFLDAEEPPAGWRAAVDVTVARLDPVAVLTGRADAGHPSAAGALLGAAWLAAAAATVTWRARLPADLRHLHAIVGVAALLGLVSLSRVQGAVFPYLTLWSWGTAVAMAGATIWTPVALRAPAARTATRRAQADAGEVPRSWSARIARDARARAIATGAPAVVLAGALVSATVSAATAHPAAGSDRNRQHATVFPAAFEALEQGTVPGFGIDDRYVVRADDGVTGGMSAFTVLNEMERRGFDAGLPPAFAVSVRRSRVIAPRDVTAVLTYAVGPAIDEMRARPGAVELADAPLPAEVAAEGELLRADIAQAFRAAGRPDLVRRIDSNILGLVLVDGGVPAGADAEIQRLIEIGGPVAIFVEPVSAR